MDDAARDDPAMEPHASSTWWNYGSTVAIQTDPETATLVIRLQLALNALVAQISSANRCSRMPESAVKMRDLFVSLLTTASYTKEAMNILTGLDKSPAEYERVIALATLGGVPPALTKKIGKICGGTHAATPILTKLRNRLGFHWEPELLKSALLEFVPNRRVVWVEAPAETPENIVHRLAIEVVAQAMLPSTAGANDDIEVRSLLVDRQVESGIEAINDAAQAIVRFFQFAVWGYFRSTGVETRRRHIAPAATVAGMEAPTGVMNDGQASQPSDVNSTNHRSAELTQDEAWALDIWDLHLPVLSVRRREDGTIQTAHAVVYGGRSWSVRDGGSRLGCCPR